MIAPRHLPDGGTPPSARQAYLTYVCQVNIKTDIRLSFFD